MSEQLRQPVHRAEHDHGIDAECGQNERDCPALQVGLQFGETGGEVGLGCYPQIVEIGLGGQMRDVRNAAGLTHGVGERFRLLLVETGIPQTAGDGERVENRHAR